MLGSGAKSQKPTVDELKRCQPYAKVNSIIVVYGLIRRAAGKVMLYFNRRQCSFVVDNSTISRNNVDRSAIFSVRC